MKSQQVSIVLFTTLFLGLLYSSLPGQNIQHSDSIKTNVAIATVYYFHGQFRCTTCNNMEKWTQEIVETIFKKELDKGVIKFQAINYETKENEHFNNKYMLSNKHIILSRNESGTETYSRELEKIWEKVRDKTKYETYIENEIRAFLKHKNVKSQIKK